MSIARLMTIGAAGADSGPPDSALITLAQFSDTSGGPFEDSIHLTETNDPNKFLFFYFASDTHRARVVTLSGATISLGPEFVLIGNHQTQSRNAGWVWDAASNAAIGVGHTSVSRGMRIMRVTFSGTSISFTTVVLPNPENFATPQTGPGLVYNDTHDVYFAAYFNNSGGFFIRPFSVSGASITLGTERFLANMGGFVANPAWITSAAALYVQGLGGSGTGSFHRIFSFTYSGGINGTFTTVISGSNYNNSGVTDPIGGMLYNEAENTLYLFSTENFGGQNLSLRPATPGPGGTLSIGPKAYINPNNFSQPDFSGSGTSFFRGGFFDTISQAVIISQQTALFTRRIVQLRSVGNVLVEQIILGSRERFNTGAPPATSSVTLDTVNARTLLAAGQTQAGTPVFSFLSLTP